MASGSRSRVVSRDPRDPHRIEEGRVACSPDEWAGMTLECLSIPPSDPQKNDKLWSFGITDHAFSSGSKLSLEHYLRFRILWYTWPDPGSFRKYIRNNPDLLNDNGESTRYDGYISPESDRLANEIYNAIKPKLDGYLDDIRRVGQGDPTRPSEECGAFENTRYWQGLVSGITKQVYDEDGQKVVFRGKVRKSEAASLLIEDSSPVPRTPLVNGSSRQPQQGFGTPHLAAPGASAGGLQNPATSDEGFVNVALVLMLQAITRLMRRWEEDQKAGNSPSGRSTSRVDSQTISSAPSQTAPSAPSQTGFRASSSGNPMDSTPASSRASSPTSNQRPDDYSEEPSSSSASSPAQVRGLGCLDWLITRLPLRLTDSSSEVAPSEELMQARVDGYLSRRHFMRKPGDEPGIFEIRRSELPLAILEAKPFTRLSALSATRWQESAEMAAWVSGLDDEYEDVGLLQSSRSGRKRRLLISQDRHELYIIIAEYGDKWKDYIKGQPMKKPADFKQSQDVKDLAGSPGFVSLADEACRERFDEMMEIADEAKIEKGSTRASRGRNLKLPGPEYFCVMNQWGPYKTGDAAHMDFFVRRMIGLHVELVKNWPARKFPHPYPE